MENPIVDELVEHLKSRKEVDRIHAEDGLNPNKKVTFFFADGTTSLLQIDCDHKTFMRWWRALETFIRLARRLPDLRLPE